MSTTDPSTLDHVFGALAHEVRRRILEDVSEAPKSVLQLAEPHEMSLNAVSKHIRKLEQAGLVQRKIDGSFHRISIERDALRACLEWLSHYAPFWSDNLASLKSSVERPS